MPRIPDCIADSAIYLYPNENAAKNGLDAGGSGFLVNVPSSTFDKTGALHLYAVTNRHMVDDSKDGKFWTIRLTKKLGGIDVIETKKDEWFLHDEADVAIRPIAFDPEKFKWWSVPRAVFLDKEGMKAYKIGYGDDVFMVGRMIMQSGKERNTPVARFGTLALLADENEPVAHHGRKDEAFLIECHSINGYSGSPVFLMSERYYRDEDEKERMAYWQKKHGVTPDQRWTTLAFSGPVGPVLLGVDFGHIRAEVDVYRKSAKVNGPTDYKAKENTGIAGVVPVWKLDELLDTPQLKQDREREDAELKEKLQGQDQARGSFVLDSAPQMDDPEPSFTQADFEQALRKVSRRVESSQSDLEKN